MSMEKVQVVERVLAAAAALVVVLALSASAGAAPATPLREVTVVEGAVDIGSDGVRFAWATNEHRHVVRVFDTLHGSSFELTPPRPGCGFGSIGGGFAVWGCVSPETMLLTNLSTGQTREPAGVDQVKPMYAPDYNVYCGDFSIGRYWLGFICGNGFGGGGGDWFFLTHRDGRLMGGVEFGDELDSPGSPFVDLDYTDLVRPHCVPLKRAELSDYQPPLGLEAPLAGWSGPISLRRCGTRRAEILSDCVLRVCRTAQLGSRYVTWGVGRRVYAYLPRIRRRVLVGRAPASLLSVAHTCTQIFALSPRTNTVYAARFEPARGAPPCQTAS
jgi:hypothetical protein